MTAMYTDHIFGRLGLGWAVCMHDCARWIEPSNSNGTAPKTRLSAISLITRRWWATAS